MPLAFVSGIKEAEPRLVKQLLYSGIVNGDIRAGRGPGRRWAAAPSQSAAQTAFLFATIERAAPLSVTLRKSGRHWQVHGPGSRWGCCHRPGGHCGSGARGNSESAVTVLQVAMPPGHQGPGRWGFQVHAQARAVAAT